MPSPKPMLQDSSHRYVLYTGRKTVVATRVNNGVKLAGQVRCRAWQIQGHDVSLIPCTSARPRESAASFRIDEVNDVPVSVCPYLIQALKARGIETALTNPEMATAAAAFVPFVAVPAKMTLDLHGRNLNGTKKVR